MVDVASLTASFKDLNCNLSVFSVALKASVMTEELLRPLLRLWALELRDEEHRTRIKSMSSIARLEDTLPTKAALILKLIGIDFGHTIYENRISHRWRERAESAMEMS